MDDEELLLIEKAQSGDDAALSRLVTACLPLVRYAVGRRAYPGEYPDLIQTGAVGLIKAILRFDPHRGAAFSTYAYSRISGELMNQIKRVPVPAAVSLDSPEAESGSRLQKALIADCEAFERVEDRIFTEQIMSSLPERERELIRLRFFCGLTQKKTGERLGLSQPQASRLERRTLEGIRKSSMD